MTITKEILVEALCVQTSLPRQQSKRLVEAIFEQIKKALESGDDVLISGFGKFYVREKAPRRGRNPATGGDLTLDARRVITFRCSPVLRKKLNGAELRTEASH